MKLLAYLLLGSGFIVAAFASLSRLEQTDDKWATVKWDWYAAGMGAGAVGVVILRRARRDVGADDAATHSEFSALTRNLDELVSVVERLAEGSERLPSSVLRCIDDECSGPLAEFAESRESIIKRHGIDTYAAVMTEFASAERNLNRTWSAAADGYVDEVAASLDRARSHLRRAQSILDEAKR